MNVSDRIDIWYGADAVNYDQVYDHFITAHALSKF